MYRRVRVRAPYPAAQVTAGELEVHFAAEETGDAGPGIGRRGEDLVGYPADSGVADACRGRALAHHCQPQDASWPLRRY
jgi:hypothetical protein